MTDSSSKTNGEGVPIERTLDDLPTGRLFTPDDVRKRRQPGGGAPGVEISVPSPRKAEARGRAVAPREEKRTAGDTISGLSLAFFVVAAAILSILFFAATQFQGKLNEHQVSGVPLTVWRLDGLARDYRALRQAIQKEKESLAVTQAEHKRRNDFLIQKSQEVETFDALRRETLRWVFAAAEEIEAGIDGRLSQDRPIEASFMIRKDPVLSGIEEIKANLAIHDEVFGGLAQRKAEAAQLKAEVTGLSLRVDQQKLALGQRELEAGRFAALGVEGSTPDMAMARERIENLLSEIGSMGDSPFWHVQMLYSFALAPRELIILALVLSMGVLGSALYMASQFEAGDRRHSWQSQILRLCAGAVTALVLYIVAKAGLLVVADGSQLSGSAPANPFFTSFLGIVAGLMSERVIQSVRTVGERFLQKGVEAPTDPIRYANADLTPVLAASKRTPEQLAPYLSPLTSEEVKDIIVGRRGAKSAEQQIIAAFIQKPPREIFTDLRG